VKTGDLVRHIAFPDSCGIILEIDIITIIDDDRDDYPVANILWEDGNMTEEMIEFLAPMGRLNE
jgi:hypothetical protein|tara:strand:- start:18457 stop:18648 length:192 start_codon:yes stop_codon:yes gene_type:complete